MLTTHYMEEADKLCNRIAIMDHGKILALDTPAALKRSVEADTLVTVRSPGDPQKLAELLTAKMDRVVGTRLLDGGVELQVKGAPTGLLPQVVTVAEGAGFDVVDLSVSETTLETVFISLTGKGLRD